MPASTSDDAIAGASLIRHLSQLFAFDRWANRRVLDAMDSIDPLPQKPLDRLSHLVICQRLWLSRSGQNTPSPADIFPTWPIDKTRPLISEIGDELAIFIDKLTPDTLHQPFTYSSFEGSRFSSNPYEFLTQLALHGCYHRGQIAVEINHLLDEPVATDFLIFSRQSAD